jgi:SWI/SNF-related matrix-associated actin-dependent regulator 1 of chromatin subfamily A
VYLLGDGTIDEYLYNLIQTKKNISNGVTGTEEETEEKKVSQTDMIFEAAMNIFGSKIK